MSLYVSPEWKKVPGAQTVKKRCPRCRNLVEFYLARDSHKLFFFIPIHYVYVLCCPICVHEEEVSRGERKELMRQAC
jgi:hypothetical protein